MIDEIASASGKQADGITGINSAINNMNQTTQQYASNAEHGAAASEELSSQATNLKELVKVFHLDKQDDVQGMVKRENKEMVIKNSNEEQKSPNRGDQGVEFGPEDVVSISDEDYQQF